MEIDLLDLTPMTAKTCPRKIPHKRTIAEEKFDGYRELMVIENTGNTMLSRSLKNNTALLPHLAKHQAPFLEGTVLDGELVSPTGLFEDLRGMCGNGTLPETAIKNQQEKGWVHFKAFDILYWRGQDVRSEPWWKRRELMVKAVTIFDHAAVKPVDIFTTQETALEMCKLYQIPMIKEVYGTIIVDDYKALLEEMWSRGKEGLMIKDIYGIYEPKRSKSVLKLKSVKTYDVIITGFQKPKREFEGKTDLSLWPYWEDSQGRISTSGMFNDPTVEQWPVTKPHALGYVGAIEFGVYKTVAWMDIISGKVFPLEEDDFDGISFDYIMPVRELVKVGECRGLTDETCEMIKQHDPKDLIGEVIEVKAQGIYDKEKGTLRHPRFSRWRPDKLGDECTWENHLEVG